MTNDGIKVIGQTGTKRNTQHQVLCSSFQFNLEIIMHLILISHEPIELSEFVKLSFMGVSSPEFRGNVATWNAFHAPLNIKKKTHPK